MWTPAQVQLAAGRVGSLSSGPGCVHSASPPAPPQGRGIPGQGPSLGRPALTGFPPPQPTPKRTQLRTHPPTHQAAQCLPGPEPGAGAPGPDVAPALWGPALGVGTRVAVTAVWPIDFWPHQPGPGGWGELGQGWATWVPWPRGVPGAAPPGSVVSRPTQLPLGPPACCPPSRGCALRLPTSRLVTPTFAGGSGISPDLSLPKLCAAATGSIFFKNRMDVRKTTIPQNHTQGVDRAGSLALNNRAATSLMGNKNKQPTGAPGLGASTCSAAPPSWYLGPRSQTAGVRASWRGLPYSTAFAGHRP